MECMGGKNPEKKIHRHQFPGYKMKLYSDFMMGIYLDKIIFMVIPGSLSENLLTFLPTPIMRQKGSKPDGCN